MIILPVALLLGCAAAWLLGQPLESRAQYLCRLALLMVSLVFLYIPFIISILIGFKPSDVNTLVDAMMILAYCIIPPSVMGIVYLVSRRTVRAS